MAIEAKNISLHFENIKLRKALDNCYMQARRMIVRLQRQNSIVGMEDRLAAWKDVARFCEEAGLKQNILRDNDPDETGVATINSSGGESATPGNEPVEGSPI